ncbi:MAG: hypothetical protein E6R14_06395 [Thermomicrobiales bacterium]|nr:MAG: hypothetical protein E6R14_06395 [Thermomicrobiales bacterium]
MCIRLNRPIMTMLPCLMLLVLTSCLSGPPGRSLNDTLQIDGTRIGVLKGMMRFLADDSELAVVIAHELGHCRRGHVEQRRARQGKRFASIASLWGAKRSDRDEEREADVDALHFVYDAGLPLEAAVLRWEGKAAALKAGCDSVTNQTLLSPDGAPASLPAWFDRALVFGRSTLLRRIAQGHAVFSARHRRALEQQRARLKSTEQLSDRYAASTMAAEAHETIMKIQREIGERERSIERASINAIRRQVGRLAEAETRTDPNGRLIALLDEAPNLAGTVSGDAVPPAFRP